MLVVVSGIVPPPRQEELEAAFAYLKEQPLPPGVVRSTLSRCLDIPDKYLISTVWKSPEAYQRYIRKVKVLRTVRLFRKFGIKPEVLKCELLDTIP
jgi:hypothetical protein